MTMVNLNPYGSLNNGDVRKTGPHIEWCPCKYRLGFVALALKRCRWVLPRVLVGVAASWRWDALGGLRSCPAFPGGLLEERDAGDVLGHCAFSRPWFAVVAMLCAVVAVGLQIAVNYLNDYADGVRGTDARRGSDAADLGGCRLPELTPVACCWLPRSPL